MTNHIAPSGAPIPAVLTIAGSDSGGGAGIQADLKAFTALGCFGTSAITCVTAQNPDGVRGVAAIPAGMVREQIEAVMDGFPVAAVKTGMLYSAAIVEEVAATLSARRPGFLVVDPVMVATSGARLLEEDAVAAVCEALLPLADVVTPNLPEAEVLCGHPIVDRAAAHAAAGEIGERFGIACALKGGHLDTGALVIDLLYADGETESFPGPRVAARETHGTGCTFAAALVAWLAKGSCLAEAMGRALDSQTLTGPGALVGTLPYMAPEQVAGEHADARTDIYALGVMLYEAIAGRRPFEGRVPAALAASILRGSPRELHAVDPPPPPSLVLLVNRCLERDPADRWQKGCRQR